MAIAPTHDSRQSFCLTRPTAITASSATTPRLSLVPTTRPPKFVSAGASVDLAAGDDRHLLPLDEPDAPAEVRQHVLIQAEAE